MNNLITETRYKVLHDLPLISEFKKGDILFGVEAITKHGKIDMREFPDHFRPLLWFHDRSVSELPEKELRATVNYTIGSTNSVTHAIEAGKIYNIFQYKIAYSAAVGVMVYAVKIHLPTGVASFPLNYFIPVN